MLRAKKQKKDKVVNPLIKTLKLICRLTQGVSLIVKLFVRLSIDFIRWIEQNYQTVLHLNQVSRCPEKRKPLRQQLTRCMVSVDLIEAKYEASCDQCVRNGQNVAEPNSISEAAFIVKLVAIQIMQICLNQAVELLNVLA